jgi:hypothetical protein
VAVDRFHGEVQAAYDEASVLLKSEGLVRADGSRDTKVAKELMKSVLGEDCILTDKGQISLSEEACQRAGHPTLLSYQLYGSRKNLLSRLEGLEKGYDKPLSSRFDSLKETGRTSCSKGDYGHPLQNMLRIPGERECFVPRPGNVFIACDFDGFELCTLAQVCLWSVGESRLAQVINEGRDVHLFRASEALGEPYEDLKAILDTPDHPRRKDVKRVRQLCKISNFGYPGGMGSKSFVGYARKNGVHIDLAQSEELKEDWRRDLPEMVKYHNWISNGHQWRQITRKSGIWNVTTVHQFRSDRVRGAVSYTDDEYLLEGPEETANEAAHVVQEIMESEAQKWIPDVKITASPCLMRRWSKDAEPVWRNGVLIPWEDR